MKKTVQILAAGAWLAWLTMPLAAAGPAAGQTAVPSATGKAAANVPAAPAKAAPAAKAATATKPASAVAAKPADRLAPFLRAIQGARDLSSANEAYAKAYAIAGDNPALLQAYVAGMVRLGAPQLARVQAEALVKQKGDHGLAWGVLAFIAARQGRMQAALDDVVKAAASRANDAFVQQTAGSLVAWHDRFRPTLPVALEQALAKMRGALASKSAFEEGYRVTMDALAGRQPSQAPASGYAAPSAGYAPPEVLYPSLTNSGAAYAPAYAPTYVPPVATYSYGVPGYSTYWWYPNEYYGSPYYPVLPVIISTGRGYYRPLPDRGRFGFRQYGGHDRGGVRTFRAAMPVRRYDFDHGAGRTFVTPRTVSGSRSFVRPAPTFVGRPSGSFRSFGVSPGGTFHSFGGRVGGSIEFRSFGGRLGGGFHGFGGGPGGAIEYHGFGGGPGGAIEYHGFGGGTHGGGHR